MAFSSWRGTVGIIKPTLRPGGLEELIRMLPEGIGVVPLSNNIRKGTRDEFAAVMAGYEDMTRQLAEAGVDVINPSGAPPFMVLGFKGERELIATWEKKYGKPIFTSGMTHVDALNVLGTQGREVKGPTTTIGGIVHFHPIDQHHSKIGISATEIDGAHPPSPPGLIDVEAWHLAQEVRDTGLLLCGYLAARQDCHTRRRLTEQGRGHCASHHDGFQTERCFLWR